MRSNSEHNPGDKSETGDGATALIDLHCHIIPGVDDGARDDEQTLRMLRTASADGIGTIVATPHAGHTDRTQIESGLARVNRIVHDAGVDVRVLPGCEVRIGADLVPRVHSGELLTINGTSYLLLELYLAHSWAMDIVELVVDRLQSADIWPVLAHVERYPTVQRDLSSIDGLLRRGVPMQVNALSLAGYHGPAAQETAERLAKAGNLHLLATDAHNEGRRAPKLTAAYGRLAELVGSEAADEIKRNAWKVLNNKSLKLYSADAIR